MRIAFLIQCHKSVEQINMLTGILSSDGDDVYVHLDKKSPVNRESIHTNNNVFLLPSENVVSVKWGGFSQCSATLRLINEVLKSQKKYDYLWLISGQDFPIKSMAFIKEKLSANKKISYIDIISKEKTEKLCFDKRNDIAYPKWIIGKKIYQKIFRNLLYIITGGKKKTFVLLKKSRPIKELYYGSSWWCLPYDCVLDMMLLLESIKDYDKYFSSSLCADESYFQTLFMQTKYASKQADILTYIDWSARDCSPKTFTKEDYDFIRDLPDKYLFVRKVDIDIDRELIDLLAKENKKP